MDFHTVDMVIVGLILFLAIKGLVNGFFQELFNFLGLIGGIAVAARTHEKVGELIAEQNVLPEILVNYQKVIGFVAVFLAIWILFNLVSSILDRFTSSETSIISRLLGYIIGLARYGFIFALIIFGFNNANFLKEKFYPYYKGSKLFVPMVTVGEKLLCKENNQTITMNDENATTIKTNNDTNLSRDMEKVSVEEDNVSH
jgi:membrane protein required for colicin V production